MSFLIFSLAALSIGCASSDMVKRESDLYKIPLPKNSGILEMKIPIDKFPYQLSKPVTLWKKTDRPKRIFKNVDTYYKPIMIVPYGQNYLMLLKDGVTLMSLEFNGRTAEIKIIGTASTNSLFNLTQWHGRGEKAQLTTDLIRSLTFQFESFVSAAEAKMNVKAL